MPFSSPRETSWVSLQLLLRRLRASTPPDIRSTYIVTQNLLRFVILQYRDELLTLSGPVGHPARNGSFPLQRSLEEDLHLFTTR